MAVSSSSQLTTALIMSSTEPSEFLTVSGIIVFLDLCTIVTTLILTGECSASRNQWKLSETYDRLKSYITDFQEEETRAAPKNDTSRTLLQLRSRCLGLATRLADPIGATITALATEEVEVPDPEQGWKLILPRFKNFNDDDDTCDRLTQDLASWLALALQ